MPPPPREPVPDLMAEVERGVADPDNNDPAVVRIRDLRSMAAEGSAGGVTATVDGYGRLKTICIPPGAVSDLPRLGRSVRRAVNLAINESEHRRPPLPPSFGSNLFGPRCLPPLRPPTHAHYGGLVTPEDSHPWHGLLPRVDRTRRDAFSDAAHIVRERILRDADRVEADLTDMLLTVYLHLGRPRLHAAWVRRIARVTDVSSLEWFRAEARTSLSRYIRHRRLETAARMIGAPSSPSIRSLTSCATTTPWHPPPKAPCASSTKPSSPSRPERRRPSPPRPAPA